MPDKNPWTLSSSKPEKPNSWDSWENDPERTTAPQAYVAEASAGRKSSTAKTVGVTLLVVVVLGLIGSAGYLVYSGQLSTLAKKDPRPEVVTITETVRASTSKQQEAIQSSATEANAPTAFSTVVQAAPQAPTKTQGREGRIRALPPEMNENGWKNIANAQCANGDLFRFAGRAGDDYALICDGPSGLYYQGFVDGGAFSSAVSKSGTKPSAHYYVVPADPATIIVTATDVRVEQNGSVLLKRVFTENHDNKY